MYDCPTPAAAGVNMIDPTIEELSSPEFNLYPMARFPGMIEPDEQDFDQTSPRDNRVEQAQPLSPGHRPEDDPAVPRMEGHDEPGREMIRAYQGRGSRISEHPARSAKPMKTRTSATGRGESSHGRTSTA